MHTYVRSACIFASMSFGRRQIDTIAESRQVPCQALLYLQHECRDRSMIKGKGLISISIDRVSGVRYS